jgi:hypothetical protein
MENRGKDMEKLIKTKFLNGGKYQIYRVARQYGGDLYHIEKFAEEWPSDQELLNLCEPYNFGGVMKFKYDNRAMLVAYTD